MSQEPPMPTSRPRPRAHSALVLRGAALGLAAVALAVSFGWPARSGGVAPRANPAEPTPRGGELEAYEALRKSYQDLSYEGLVEKLGPRRDDLARLSFDPTRAQYFGIVKERLGLVDREVAMLREN